MSASPQAHAAQLKPAVEKSNMLPMDEKQTNNSDNEAACGGITSQQYWWGIEFLVPKCLAQQLANGVNLIPTAGPIASTLVNSAINVSCNGNVYVDVYPNLASIVRPAC